jgi:multidrug efflux pump subunit AcrA (membrane-fusion protein)
MTRATPAERALVMIGVLPLLAAGVWLVLLREPTPATASTRGAGMRPSVETLVAKPEGSFVGVIVAGQDAELGAELTGEVARVFVEPGARVRRGDPLLQLSALSVMGARGMAAA